MNQHRMLTLVALVLGCGTPVLAAPQRINFPDPNKPSNVALEVEDGKRRVLVEAVVCLREGMLLEHLMCRKRTKEHEAILTADVDARHIHAALVLAGAEPGSPLKYRPKFQLPTGTPIRITLEYDQGGKKIRVPAREWIRDVKTKKTLDVDWVFAGSFFEPNPEKGKPDLFAANSGDIICICNFETALLDLPINSSKNNADLLFEMNTPKIPPLESKVTVILEPLLPAKK
jgi:hypothetical protein